MPRRKKSNKQRKNKKKKRMSWKKTVMRLQMVNLMMNGRQKAGKRTMISFQTQKKLKCW